MVVMAVLRVGIPIVVGLLYLSVFLVSVRGCGASGGGGVVVVVGVVVMVCCWRWLWLHSGGGIEVVKTVVTIFVRMAVF